jgi:hypothetical protein
MKLYEEKLRKEPPPYTLVLTSGEKVKARGRDHISLPSATDENGKRLRDGERSDFFQVWTDGKAFRWICFATISAIETQAPRNGRNAK